MSERHIGDPDGESRREKRQNPSDVGAAPDEHKESSGVADERVRVERPEGEEAPKPED